MKIKPLYREAEWDLPAQEELEKEFREAKRFGEIRIGKENLFYRGFIRIRSIQLRECERIYLRIEMGEYGEFPLHEHYIVVRAKEGQETALRIERPKDAGEILDYIGENVPGIRNGKEPG